MCMCFTHLPVNCSLYIFAFNGGSVDRIMHIHIVFGMNDLTQLGAKLSNAVVTKVMPIVYVNRISLKLNRLDFAQ
jgi:hypothetical protein